jgi:hypothetical protein
MLYFTTCDLKHNFAGYKTYLCRPGMVRWRDRAGDGKALGWASLTLDYTPDFILDLSQ